MRRSKATLLLAMTLNVSFAKSLSASACSSAVRNTGAPSSPGPLMSGERERAFLYLARRYSVTYQETNTQKIKILQVPKILQVL